MFKVRKVHVIAATITCLLVSSAAVYGKQGGQTVNIQYNDIKIMIDGVELKPTDGNGNSVEPFILSPMM